MIKKTLTAALRKVSKENLDLEKTEENRVQDQEEKDETQSKIKCGQLFINVNGCQINNVASESVLVYVVITLENQFVKTSKIYAKNECVEWNEGFTFDVTSVNAHLRLQVWGVDNNTKPLKEDEQHGHFFGQVSTPISSLKHGKPIDDTYLLADHAGKILPQQPKSSFLHIKMNFTTSNESVGMDSFELLSVVGKGTFGKVMQVKKQDTGRLYAMKVIHKDRVISLNAIKHTLAERNVLKQVQHPFIVNLKFSFQTQDSLYLVMDYVNGGELFYHMTHADFFSKARARFYAAEIVLALGFLHSNNIIYRDLKPENLLLDMSGHICITDFGLSKEELNDGGKTFTFCGSPEYLAPEIIKGEGYNHSIDWWALGTLLYEMMSGWPPFFSEDLDVMNRKIVSGTLTFPPFFDEPTRSLCSGLLEKDPLARLSDTIAIKNHPFFSTVDWQKLLQKQIDPPFKPHLLSESDVRYFDREFTTEFPRFSPHKSEISSSQQEHFKGFSFCAPEMEAYFKKKRSLSKPPQLSGDSCEKKLRSLTDVIKEDEEFLGSSETSSSPIFFQDEEFSFDNTEDRWMV